MGYPHSWMVYNGKSHLEVDEDWWYSHFRKPLNGKADEISMQFENYWEVLIDEVFVKENI